MRLLPDWPSQRQLKVERQIGERVLALVQGDITGFAAEAIVNAANASLSGGGGVDGAIHRVGGPAIMTELRARHDGCQTGRAVATAAGRLPARWVVHAVGPIWRGGANRERELLASAYREALAIADDLGARSISLAAISCGVYGYPVREAAEVAIATVADHLGRDTSLERATFVLRSDDVFDAFQHSLHDFTADTDT
jgi:O-acetyl-ADP-ribose deacetylase (regulator of RNase III)